MARFIPILYSLGYTLTFVYLTFFDGYSYNWWNWTVAIPANILIATAWPGYWVYVVWFD